MASSLPSSTITGTSASDVRATTPGVAALVETYGSADTITLQNQGDWGVGGDGADSIRLGTTAAVSVNQSVQGGYGKDTISIGSDSVAAATFAIGANQGNDSISIQANAAIAMSLASMGGGLGNDTVVTSGIATMTQSTIKGGDNNDSIVIASGAITNGLVLGNKGADFLDIGFTASTGGTVGGGLGQDTIMLSGVATGAAASLAVGGGGADSINFVLAGDGTTTIAGGGLGDTITLNNAVAGITIYGDAYEVTTAGTGTGGTADGADLIGATTANLDAASSIYGAGGNDTITINSAAGTVVADGGNNNDSITLTHLDAASTVTGGAGADTIAIATAGAAVTVGGGFGADIIQLDAGGNTKITGDAGTDTILVKTVAAGTNDIDGGDQADGIYFATATTGTLALLNGTGTIKGGAGADTIAFDQFETAISVLGGAGNDSIAVGMTVAADLLLTNVGTIDGGAGSDTITFLSSKGDDIVRTAGTQLTGQANIAYGSGDVIVINTTAALSTTNVYNGSTTGFANGILISAVAGTISVYSDGTDTVFTVTDVKASGLTFKITGADLVNTVAADNTLISAGAGNASFGFSVAADTATSYTITLT